MSWLAPLAFQIAQDFEEAARMGRRREFLGSGFLVRTVRHREPIAPYGSPCRVERLACPRCGEPVEIREGCSRPVHLSGGAGCRRVAREAA